MVEVITILGIVHIMSQTLSYPIGKNNLQFGL
jgi:hypothetical protein